MNFHTKNNAAFPALKLISPMIFVYLLALALIDKVFYPEPTLSLYFYLIIGLDALLILLLTYTSPVQRVLGKALIPLIVVLLIIVPIFSTFISKGGQPVPMNLDPGGGGGPEMETLRLIPLTFTALVLVAWQYRMKHVFLFGLFTILAHAIIAIIRVTNTPNIMLSPWYVVMTIQSLSLIIVGYFINLLVRQLKKQQDTLQEANKNLVDYAGTLENLTISRERNAMARELHDTVAHTLSGLSVQLETARAYLDVDVDTARSMLDRSLTVTRSGLDDTRRALQFLRASPLEDLGLVNALKAIAENTASRGNLTLSLQLPQTESHLPGAYEQVIYRIAQEALNNILHHANASTIALSLTRENDELHLLVTDDGIGFDPEQQYENHFGLVGMRERAELIGGDLKIDSHPGQGTRLHLELRYAE